LLLLLASKLASEAGVALVGQREERCPVWPQL